MVAPLNSQQTQQTLQVPNYSGVNIQIFNPSVNAPGSNASTNTSTTTNTTNPFPFQSYPQQYYTQAPQTAQSPVAQPAPVAPAPVEEKKKTEKRDIVQLTDDYIKNLEIYLSSQNADVRTQGGQQVIDRLKEDDSRKNDPALNALVNKMLQDPSQKVRLIGLSAVDSGIASGNSETVAILNSMQQKSSGFGEDSLSAANALLKMSASRNTIQKEFEVKDKPKNDKKAK
ncbi:hypothetical protein KBA27_02545 [bacterium]|nr:hypothetical protein [bacterium]